MRRLLMLLCACAPPLAPATGDSDVGQDTGYLGFARDWCADLDRSQSPLSDVVKVWTEQDATAAPALGQVVFVGSSSMRRWESVFRVAAAHGVVQRGFGGATMNDVAQHTPELILAHKPSAVVLFAGTNDVAMERSAERVADEFRCVVQQVRESLGRGVPIIYVGITPTPARWESWAQASQVNGLISGIARANSSIYYADVPALFLKYGEPPASKLYVADQLHLSQDGYYLFEDAILPQLRAAAPSTRDVPNNPDHPDSGAVVRLDLGPSNDQDGAPAELDDQGRQWNAWHGVQSGVPILAGERLAGLKTTTGLATGMSVVITGGFLSRGRQDGGLLNPSRALLGELAVPAATVDYFYSDGPDNPGGLSIIGLDPAQSYTLRLFASSATTDERRITSYRIYGEDERQTGLTTSGRDVGNGGYDGNNRDVAVVSSMIPDKYGQIHIDVGIAAGSFAYLSLIELVVD